MLIAKGCKILKNVVDVSDGNKFAAMPGGWVMRF